MAKRVVGVDSIAGSVYRRRHRSTGELMDETREYICIPTGLLESAHTVKTTVAAEHEVISSLKLVRRNALCGHHRSLGIADVSMAELSAILKD